MADLPRHFKTGDELTGDLIQAILDELWRWRKAHASAPLNLDNADGRAMEPPGFWLSADLPLTPAQAGSSGVSAGTPSAPTSGTVNLVYNSGAAGSPALSSSAVDSLTVYNAGAAVASNGLCWIIPFQGQWWVVTGQFQGLIPAQAPAGGIAAGSMGAPSSATVQPLAVGSGPVLTTSGGGATVTAYNAYTSAVAANALIWILTFGGYYWVVAANC